MGSLYARLYSFTEQEVAGAANTIEDTRWAERLAGAASYIYARLTSVFPSADEWATVMTERAVPGYASYVNPTHPKAGKAVAKYSTKLPTAYDAWRAGVEAAFNAPDAYFADRVQSAAAQDKYSANVKPVLMAVGAPEVGPSIGPKIVWILEGYDISRWLRTDIGEQFSDTLENKPIVNPVFPRYAVAIINAMIVDAIRWHRAYLDAGMGGQAAAYLSAMQDAIAAEIRAKLNANLQLDGFVLTWESNTGRYRVELSISDATP